MQEVHADIAMVVKSYKRAIEKFKGYKERAYPCIKIINDSLDVKSMTEDCSTIGIFLDNEDNFEDKLSSCLETKMNSRILAITKILEGLNKKMEKIQYDTDKKVEGIFKTKKLKKKIKQFFTEKQNGEAYYEYLSVKEEYETASQQIDVFGLLYPE